MPQVAAESGGLCQQQQGSFRNLMFVRTVVNFLVFTVLLSRMAAPTPYSLL